MFFSNGIRAKIKEDNPELAFSDIAKLVGTIYKEASKEEMVKFDEEKQKDKERCKICASN